MPSTKQLALLLGPFLALIVYLLLASHQPIALAMTVAVTCWCILWWVFEPVPIPITSLLPFAIFQLTGILTKNEVAQAYGNPLILLLLGGFILSKAMEKSGAHLRLALFLVNLFGNTSSRQLVLGFMATAAILSMWISNTATTLMLLPVALAVIKQSKDYNLAAPLMLGIAYAASIGGVGTPIGTPPNLVFMQVYQDHFQKTVSFIEWMQWGVPIVICMIPITWLWLTRKLTYKGQFHMPAVGQWQPVERRVLLIFALTAFIWITRQEPFGGWSTWLNLPAANDASVALLAVVLMFVTPDGKGEKLLDWETAASIPWGVLILFGGGICLAKAFTTSGLSAELATNLTYLSTLPILLMLFSICLAVTFLTETTSNTASAILLMPLLAAAALGMDSDPKLLMAPAAISASFAFMMPVATAPNTIVYGSGHLTVKRMVKEGFVLNILGAIIIASLCYLILI